MPLRKDSRPLFTLIVFACLPLAAACASGGSTSSAKPAPSATSNASPDDTISARVKTALLNDKAVNATQITVSTTNGVVTIGGQVKSKAEEDRAVQIARQVNGVRDVKSELRIG